MRYKIDVMRLREGKMTLQGWAIGKNGKPADSFTIYKEKQSVKADIVRTRRDDVSAIYLKKVSEEEFGFDITFDCGKDEPYTCLITAAGEQKRINCSRKMVEKRNSVAFRKREKLLALANMETVRVAWDFMKENGLRALYLKSLHKLKGIEADYDYDEWYAKTAISQEEIAKQKNIRFSYEPKFSIVVPAYRTPEKFLRMLLDSIERQTYGNWEVCVVDASGYPYEAQGKKVKDVLKEYAEKDSRFRYSILEKNLGIADNTNEAIRMAVGDFIVLADHDDELTEDALFCCAQAINENPSADVLYSDEDKIDFDGSSLFEPNFKPDYNPDLLTTVNYICHLFVVRKELLDRVGGPEKIYERKAYDGAQDYDLIFRCIEEAEKNHDEQADEELKKEGLFTSEKIYHIRKVLYHWRCHRNSTASNPEAKLYAFKAGERAIRDHFERIGVPVEKVEKGVTYGYYHTVFKIKKENMQDPKISVLIPNKDHTADLDKAIRSVIAGSYQNLEFIVIENNSVQDETWNYYEKIQKEFPEENSRNFKPTVKVVKWEKGFNFSAINNFGAQFATGSYLLCLNNDVEMKNPDSIREMLGYCQREDVGAVGVRLLYDDDTIQHAGVVIGFGGIAGHTFIGLHDAENTYMHRAKSAQDYSAVTAACMMMRREVFDAAGGYTEELEVAFNDIDLCMKIRSLGKLVVYNPYACFYHYESKSRGLEDTPEKVMRFNTEIARFAKRWGAILEKGDPYYHPCLTLRKSNFALRDLHYEKPGEPFPLNLDIEEQLKQAKMHRKETKR